ncbi:hypothetical protein C0J52_16116 [Blattella germanica]|nr:hypothetical protein C0J52_16116 [Blattella germanica]
MLSYFVPIPVYFSNSRYYCLLNLLANTSQPALPVFCPAFNEELPESTSISRDQQKGPIANIMRYSSKSTRNQIQEKGYEEQELFFGFKLFGLL